MIASMVFGTAAVLYIISFALGMIAMGFIRARYVRLGRSICVSGDDEDMGFFFLMSCFGGGVIIFVIFSLFCLFEKLSRVFNERGGWDNFILFQRKPTNLSKYTIEELRAMLQDMESKVKGR